MLLLWILKESTHKKVYACFTNSYSSVARPLSYVTCWMLSVLDLLHLSSGGILQWRWDHVPIHVPCVQTRITTASGGNGRILNILPSDIHPSVVPWRQHAANKHTLKIEALKIQWKDGGSCGSRQGSSVLLLCISVAPHTLSWEKRILICIHIWALRLRMPAGGTGECLLTRLRHIPYWFGLVFQSRGPPEPRLARSEFTLCRLQVQFTTRSALLPFSPPDYSSAPEEIKLCDKIKWPGLRCMCRNCQYQPRCPRPFADTFTSSAGSKMRRKGGRKSSKSLAAKCL